MTAAEYNRRLERAAQIRRVLTHPSLHGTLAGIGLALLVLWLLTRGA